MSVLPTTGITTSLVGTTLGASSRDVGSLVTHQNINPFSRWKPIRANTAEGITETILRNANFGILTTQYRLSDITVNPADIPTFEYLRPRGGASEPFRLGDFRSYNHVARPPLSLMMRSITPTVSNEHLYVVSQGDYDLGHRTFYEVNLTQIFGSEISISEFYTLHNANMRLSIIIGAVENGRLTTRQDRVRMFQSETPISFIAGQPDDHTLTIDTSRLAIGDSVNSPPLAVGEPYILCACIAPFVNSNPDGTFVGNLEAVVPTLRMTSEARFNTVVSGDLRVWQRPTENINVSMSLGSVMAFRMGGQIELWQIGSALNITTTTVAMHHITLHIAGVGTIDVGTSMPENLTIPDIQGNQLDITISVFPIHAHHNFVGQTSVSRTIIIN